MEIIELFWSVATMVSVPSGLPTRCSPRSLPGVRPRPRSRVTDSDIRVLTSTEDARGLRDILGARYRADRRRERMTAVRRAGREAPLKPRSGGGCVARGGAQRNPWRAWKKKWVE